MKALNIASLGEFAEYAGLKRTTMYNAVQGRVSENGTDVKPSVDTIFALARALEVSPTTLLYRLDPSAFPATEIEMPGTHIVQLIGRVGAGPGQREPFQHRSVCVSERLAQGKDLIAYEVIGDSMDGGKRPIPDGATVVVNTLDKGSSDQAVVARLRDGLMVCKMLKEDKFGSHLLSANPFYTNSTPPRIARDEIDEIIGRVVHVVQDVDSLVN
ncbi:MAG: hypothetical protein HC933_15450 [Pleurocapsa sp. SU_196_0]|nr:hypothetical protein [Pleurocapsa sp. SU_196_0]